MSVLIEGLRLFSSYENKIVCRRFNSHDIFMSHPSNFKDPDNLI